MQWFWELFLMVVFTVLPCVLINPKPIWSSGNGLQRNHLCNTSKVGTQSSPTHFLQRLPQKQQMFVSALRVDSHIITHH